eukprot:8382268-Karenia_brevis.AAC.1
MILKEGERRQGRPRGERGTDRVQEFLNVSQLDLSSCRNNLRHSEILAILLSIKKGKSPGPNGIPGIAYKAASKFLYAIFGEALHDLQQPSCEIPHSFLSALWIPIGKVENPCYLHQVRDLELPNEDRKI